MSLRDAVDAVTTAAQNAIDQLKTMADDIRNREDTTGVPEKLNEIATNIQQAVDDAKAAAAADTTQPADPNAPQVNPLS